MKVLLRPDIIEFDVDKDDGGDAVNKSPKVIAVSNRGGSASALLQTVMGGSATLSLDMVPSTFAVSPTPTATAPVPLEKGQLSKASYVQAMWFQDTRKQPSREEISRSIEALIDEAPEQAEEHEEGTQPVSLLVGEIKESARHDTSNQLVHAVQLCSYLAPRTLVSGLGIRYHPSDLRGKRCVVVTNVPLRDGRGILSEGIMLCDSQGALLSPPHDAKIGARLKVTGKKSVLKQLELSNQGYAVCTSTLAMDE
ncbi:hypothetical protein BCR37DRAFT_400265 [Protomyces lactucae-debilis]|uniref:tRNA-binding domain-containing protein n=1 Tax=Protomyces lactucae-debilis TaxID=2754530 RepID=A0A1Y2F2P2_PROLT|nr:uncharacterized protein BCR37DRAFT_400265 [Protomyces lactucae-debilis]ORY78113.1 hypothetical protein BCR37DRAFT_400265 [Protomyces lactucae-debilis]